MFTGIPTTTTPARRTLKEAVIYDVNYRWDDAEPEISGSS
jgi:hypothetical protein